ncbi:unnamed protein product [Ixodes pacificus]
MVRGVAACRVSSCAKRLLRSPSLSRAFSQGYKRALWPTLLTSRRAFLPRAAFRCRGLLLSRL